MKIRFIILAYLITAFSCFANSVFEKSIDDAFSDPSEENFAILIRHLVGIVRYKSAPKEHRYYDQLQATIISIPGHAKYLESDLMEAYEAYRNPDSPIHSASLTRLITESGRCFRALSHLPSAETVEVLGRLLPDTWYREKENVYYEITPMGVRAAHALSHLGIADAPSKPLHLVAGEPVPERELWLQWWEEIKSGQRTLSFEGRADEYRFRPDGTWEAIPVATDASASLNAEVGDPEPIDEKRTIDGSRRPIWIGGILLILIIGSLLYRRFRSRTLRSALRR